MTGSTVNSSSSASGYDWTDCETYDDTGKFRPSSGFIVFFSTCFFEFLVGAPSNLWLVCHILRRRSKDTGVLPADFFLLHLAFIQLSFYLCLPFLFASQNVWNSPIAYVMTGFLSAMALFMKPLLLCLVCVERYMAVVRPLVYLRFNLPRYRWGCLGVSWCIYVFMASASAVKRSYISVCLLFVPVLIIDTFCCLSVLKALKKPPLGDGKMMEERKQEQSRGKEERKEEQVEKVDRSGQRGKAEMNSMKKKAFLTIAVIQAVLALNYLPFIITSLMSGLVPAPTLICQFVPMSMAAAVSCTYLQPLLYLHRLGRLPCMMSKNS